MAGGYSTEKSRDILAKYGLADNSTPAAQDPNIRPRSGQQQAGQTTAETGSRAKTGFFADAADRIAAGGQALGMSMRGVGARNYRNDTSRRILAKYGLADYTPEENYSMALWERKLQRYDSGMQEIQAQLGKNSWADWQNESKYRSSYDNTMRELNEALQGMDPNDISYQRVRAYRDAIGGADKYFQARSDFYGGFANENEYNYYQDLQSSWDEASRSGKSRKDWADKIAADYERDKSSVVSMSQDIEARRAAIARAEEQGYDKMGPEWAEDLNRQRRELADLEARYEQTRAAAAKGEYQSKIAGGLKYSDLPGSADWSEGVQRGQQLYDTFYSGYQGNRAELAQEIRMGNTEIAGLGDDQLAGEDYYTFRIPTDSWDEEDKQLYYYLYQRSPEEAQQYAVEVNTNRMAMQRARRMQEYEEFGGKNFFTGALATAARVLTSPTGIWDYAGDLIRYANTGLVMPRADLSARDSANAMSAGAANALNELGTLDESVPIIGGRGLGDAYQLGNSIVESMAFAGLGKGMQALGAAKWIPAAVTNMSFFGNAASETTQEALQRGASSEQALMMGFLSGSAEALGETLSVENLIHMKDPLSVKQTLLNVLAQAGIEGSEEGFTTVLNTVADAIVMKDKSELNQQIQANLLSGMSYDEARRAAWKDWSEELAFDILGGVLSGGVSAGLQMGVSGIAARAQEYEGNQNELLDYAREVGEGSEAWKAAEQIGRKSRMSQHDANRLMALTAEERERDYREALNRDRKTIQEAAEKRLGDLGVIESARAELASIVAKNAVGDKLSSQERRTLERNPFVARVAQEAEEVFRSMEREVSRAAEKTRDKTKTSIFKESESTARADKEQTITVDGEKMQIQDVVRGEDGKLTLQVTTESGESKSVSAEKADFGESSLGELIQELQNQPDATHMYALYNGRQSIGSFINGWNTAKTIGRLSSKATAESILGDSLLQGMDPDVARYAFNLGRKEQTALREKRAAEQKKAREEENEERIATAPAEARNDKESGTPAQAEDSKSRKKGTVSYEGATVDGRTYKAVDKRSLSPRQRDQIEAVQMLAEATGIHFVLFQSELDQRGKYRGANGMYKDGTIYLDVNAGRHGQSMGQAAMVRTAAHELTHYIQDYAPERYEELQTFLLDYLIEWKGQSLGDLAAAKLQRDSTGTLSFEQALDEVVADGCEMMLRRTSVMQTMAQEKPGLFRTVKNWIQKWLKTIKAAFQGVSEVHEEARAVAQMEVERMEKLVELWDKGLIEASDRAQKSPAKEGGAVKYSFAGERAETADREKLQEAQEMEKQGIDAERIRQETGWFRGMDNKWRFEIDDSGMQLFPGGDAQFTKDHPEYTEYKILLNKAIVGTITEEDLARVKELEQTWGRELPRLSQRVQTGNATLENILQHDALFEAYPELKSLRIRFNELAAGERGQYVPESGTIVLSNKLKNETNGTLLHEIQHAIQHFENFTHGATPEYWQNRIDFLDGRIEADQSMLKAAEDKIGLKGFVADSLAKVSRGERNIDEHWRALQEFKNNSDQGEEIKRLEDDLKELRSQRGRLIDADEAYFGTAGEIEARDTAKRAKLSAGERKSTRPDLDRKGVVFAESENSFTIDLSGEKQGEKHGLILDAIRAHFSEIVNDEAVAELTGEEFGRVPGDNRSLAKKVQDYFDSLGNKVHREGFGDIGLNSAGVHDSLQHGYGRLKAMTFAALPEVLKKGKMVNSDPNHELHSYDSFLIMAPVTIREGAFKGRSYVGAIVIRDSNTKRYKIHEVLTTRENGTSSDKSEAHQKGSGLRYDVPSDNSILPESEKSKPKFQERDALPDDRALLMAAEAKGPGAEALTAYQKKVKSLEALERKLQRQQAALEEAEEKKRIATASESTGLAMTDEGKGKAAELRRAAIEGWEKQIQKTEASIRRAENVLTDMERDPQIRRAAENALAAWREQNPNEAAKALREMRQEQESLKRYVELLRQEAKLTTPETRRMLPSDINRLARALIKEHGSEAATEQIQERLQKLGDFMVSNLEGADTGYYMQIQQQARQIAREIVENSYQEIDDEKETREGIRAYLREHTLRISEELKGDIPDFNRWRKQHMGTLRLGNEGMDIDQAYQDLRASYGEGYFPADVTAHSDQLQQILDTLQAVQPSYQQMFSEMESWQATEAIAGEIIDRMLSGEVQERETMADRAFQQKMRQLEEKYARKDKARQKLLENAEDQMKWERAKRDEAEERRREERALRRQFVSEKVHELRERSIERDKRYRKRIAIDKKVTALSKIMLENSGKRHVPDAWKETIGDFLSSIDTLTEHSGEKSRAFHLERVENLQKMVARQLAANEGKRLAGENGDDGPQVYLDINPYLTEMLEPFMRMARESDSGTLTVNRMSLEQMGELEDVLTALREAIDKQDVLLAGEERASSLSGAAGDSIEHLEAMGKGSTGKNDFERRLKGFLSYDNLTPVFFFKRFGAGGEQIFRELQRGWGKLAFNSREIIEFAEKAYTAKEAKAWESEVHEFQLVKRESDLSGRKSLTKAAAEGGPEAVAKAEAENKETVKLSTAQLMGLYCLVKREQALGHILGGGIRIWDISAKKGTQEQAERYLVSAEDIATLCTELTDRQREVADELQKYMNTVGSSWGNEVSKARFGVELFTEKNYYPIETDPQSRNARNPDADGTDLFHILNMGFTKNTVKNAKNGVVLHSIFDVFANHMADMAKYNAMGLPMLDAMKWFNFRDESDGSFTSLRKAAEVAYGKNAEKYFLAFIQDLNGNHEGGRRGEDIGSKMISNAKVAAVGGNLRVAALQPTSYIRALAVLDPKYLLKGDNPLKIKQGIEEAMQYSGTAVWKDLGFFDMNINMNLRELIKHTDGAMDKLRELSMVGAEWGDKSTWGRLWNAAKAEVQAKTKLSGEELLRATAERFDDVIYQTQVMDSTMTRSHMMRQKGLYAGMVTSFMSEPTVSYNLVLNAVHEYLSARRTGGHAKAWKTAAPVMARAFAVYAVSQIATSLVESLFDALRDDDDYEELWQKWLQAELGPDGNLVQDLVLHNKLPYVRDIVSIWQGFTNKRMDTEWVDYIKRGWTAFQKVLDGEELTWGTAYTLMRAMSTTTGLPLSNLARDTVAVWNGTVVQMVPDWKLKTIKTGRSKPEASIKQAYQAGALSEEDAVRYLLRDAEIESEDKAKQKVYEWGLGKDEKKYDAMLSAIHEGDSDGANAAWQNLRDKGYSEETLHSAVKTAVKAWYQGTSEDGKRLSKQKTIDALVQHGGMRRAEAEAEVQEWTSYVSSPEKLQYDEIQEAYVSGEISAERAAEMRALYGGKSEREAESEVRKWSCEKETGIKYGDLDEAFIDGEITESEAISYRMQYGGETREKAQKTLREWSYLKDTGTAYNDVREGYVSGELSMEQAVNARVKYGGQNKVDAEREVQKWTCEKETGLRYEDLQDLYLSSEISAERAAELQVKYGSKTREDAETEVEHWRCYKETGVKYDDIRKAYVGNEISAGQVRQMLTTYGGMSADAVEGKLLQYDFAGSNVELWDVSEKAAANYYIFLSGTGMQKETWYQTWKALNGFESDKDKNGKTVKDSLLLKRAAYIDGLNLTSRQKDLVFLTMYDEKNLKKTPWH